MKDSFTTKNTGLFSNKINELMRIVNQWFWDTPQRAIEHAYKAALTIKAIEDEHFDSNKISAEVNIHSENVMSCLLADLGRNLNLIKLRLAEFKVSRSVVTISNPILLEKLKFIDSVIAKYSSEPDIPSGLMVVTEPEEINLNKVNKQLQTSNNINNVKVEAESRKKGVLPRSIGRTINRIKTELEPQAEEKVVERFRTSRTKTKTSIRFLVILVIVPLLTQQLSKHFLIEPIVERVRGEEAQVFLNFEMKEKALEELQHFEEELKFENLINSAAQLSPQLIEEQVKHKATEIVKEFRDQSSNTISNIFADLLGLIAFSWVLFTHKKEIITLKCFMDDIVYGLSDSAKAFIIILFTDIFVGYHSTHGWEVILEGLASHLGLAANRNMIFLFIATFPVILDTIFKYWIFRYLSQTSPSAVATLRNMNE